ncbi:angiopoietin-related protein 3 isoform X2 [Salvelinus namaycush]|uniref:Angiopoietin-related protein 3 isoform X2 n=1 Tax=Salvelinus namaycush TaxID=8040 RepID=A0A8U1EPC2_SALNM|nr:angiopoietin-related protein 3 isoform X2 [Salvelinus namaycush]
MKLFCLLFLVGLSVAQAAPRDSSRVYPTMPSQLQPQTQPPAEAKSRFAMLDDVRLLANGLLQLGQSLRDFVHKTKAQINDIFQKLTNFDRSFYQLSVVTSEIKEEEEELKKTTTFLKANNEEIRNLSLEINAKINSILQERSLLQSQVGGLEEKLKGLSESMMPGEQLSEIKSLKDVIEAQERTITDLLKAVKEQHDQLNQQKTKINTLEEKISIDHFQDATDKAMASDSETPDMFEYLTGNSSGEDTDLPVDCSDLYNRGERNSGVYPIKPNQSEPFNVYCELTSGEFWLGLIKIHSLAGQGDSILRIELEDWKEDRRSVEYQFTLEGPQAHYTLHLTHLSGDLPNAMGNHTRFSTKDRDNNNHQDSNCAKTYTGGWWFNACGDTNLNGRYMWLRSKGRSMRRKGIHWKPLGISYSLKTTKISIRHV